MPRVLELSEQGRSAAQQLRRARERGDLGFQPVIEQLGPEVTQGRGRTVSRKALRKQLKLQRRMYGPLEPAVTVARPRCRADCIDGPRPCPWVGCKWNLYLDVSEHGSLQLNFPELEVDQVPNNCALDLADRGGITLEQVGDVMNVTRERVRQIETLALRRLEHEGLDAPELGAGGFTYPDGPPSFTGPERRGAL